MRLDRGLTAGAEGGHGPIGYVVDVVDPERTVRFRFTRPVGFAGHHTFEVEPEAGGTVLRHELVMRVRGIARLTWPLVFRPLHDALIEDALDRAAARLEGRAWDPRPLGAYVRLLRRILRPRPGRSEMIV